MLTDGESVKLRLLATTQELSLLGKKGSHKPSLKRSHQSAKVKVAAPSEVENCHPEVEADMEKGG